MSRSQEQSASPQAVEARRREMAVEHLLFGTIQFLARRHPELLDELEGSLSHLWDLADDGSRDDEAVRDIAHRFLKSLRAEGAPSNPEAAGDD
jgi:hypothetical protein